MRTMCGAVLCAWMLVAAPGARAAPPPAAAKVAAANWLALIDARKYPQGWDEAASYLHQTIAKSAWLSSVVSARTRLGPLRSRRLDSAYATTYLPGAPYGHYVVVHYSSAFAHRPHASETITCMQGDAGRWRVVGYYVN